MATPKHDPELEKKFRRRRITVLVIAALLIWGIWAGVSAVVSSVNAIFGGKPQTGSSAAANGTSGSSSTPTTCLANGIEVTVFIGDGKSPKSSFSASETPQLWFNIVNTSDKACYFNVGSKVQTYKITSGSETIWTSGDCDRSQDINFRKLLAPGAVNSSPIGSWKKVRSSSTGCGAGQQAVVAGGASYHLTVTVNGVTSNDVQFILN